jgi:hypothetical protein
LFPSSDELGGVTYSSDLLERANLKPPLTVNTCHVIVCSYINKHRGP